MCRSRKLVTKIPDPLQLDKPLPEGHDGLIVLSKSSVSRRRQASVLRPSRGKTHTTENGIPPVGRGRLHLHPLTPRRSESVGVYGPGRINVSKRFDPSVGRLLSVGSGRTLARSRLLWWSSLVPIRRCPPGQVTTHLPSSEWVSIETPRRGRVSKCTSDRDEGVDLSPRYSRLPYLKGEDTCRT